jgi:ATP/maltotriose-dependent transcriptional regulator MalT
LPPSQETTAGLLALFALVLGERNELASLLLEVALERARREGHATRQGIVHALRGVIALEHGSLHDAQVEAETGLLLVQQSHFITPLLLGVAMVTHIERGELGAAEDLARTGDALALAEGHTHLAEFMTARGRLRMAQGRPDDAVADLLWCGDQARAAGVLWPSAWKAYAAAGLALRADEDGAARLAREQVEAARRVGTQGALGMSLRTAASAIGDEQRLPLLVEAVRVLEPSSARLELAHAYADLGTELSRLGRRTEGRDAQRQAIKLAEQCGALALADSAMAGLQAGPGRRPRTELKGPPALTAAEWRVCRQAAEGQTNRAVAAALFVTEKTVERHLSSSYQKLGIRSRHQLARALGE